MTVEQQLLIEARVANEQKSVGVAYALWFFLGIISLHRFYLGRPISAILQILSYFIIIGVVWWLVDAFLIPSMVEKHRNGVRAQMLGQFVGMPARSGVDTSKWSARDREAFELEEERQAELRRRNAREPRL